MIKNSLVSYSFLLPVIIGMAVFAMYPIVMSFIYSFTDYNGSFATTAGIFNYAEIFNFGLSGAGREVFNSFKITFIYVIASTALSMVVGYILALFLQRNIKGMKVIRLLCYLPVLIPGFVSGFIYRDIFAYSAMPVGNGLINTWLGKLGLGKLTFFGSAQTALASLVMTNLFGVGGGMIMLLAAFGNISPELYEAARIDGAGYMRRLFFITVPLSTPILFYNVVVSMITGLQIFGTMASYGTGIEDSLYFIGIRIYNTAFADNNYGLACAEGYLLFMVTIALSLLLFKFSGWVHYGED